MQAANVRKLLRAELVTNVSCLHLALELLSGRNFTRVAAVRNSFHHTFSEIDAVVEILLRIDPYGACTVEIYLMQLVVSGGDECCCELALNHEIAHSMILGI